MNRLNEHLWSGIIHRSETGESREEDKCEIQRRLDKGEEPESIFSFPMVELEQGYMKVCIRSNDDRVYNILDTSKNRLVWQKETDSWFWGILPFNNDFWQVCKGWDIDDVNLMDKKGNLLSDIWFYDIDQFNKNNIAKVQKKTSTTRKYNFIDTKGKLIWDKPIDEWFDGVKYAKDVYEYSSGFIRVKRNDKFNFIDLNGNLLWNKPDKDWFDDANIFLNDHSAVYLNGNWKYLDTKGNLHNEKP